MAIAAAIVLCWTANAVAQSNPLVGTWLIDLARSRAVLGSPSTQQKNVVEANGPDGIHYVTERTNAQGRTSRAEFTAQFDGRTYPYVPAQDWRDGVSITRVSDRVFQLSWKKGNETTGMNYWIVSEDGRTLTWVSTGIENGDQVYDRIAVLEKQ